MSDPPSAELTHRTSNRTPLAIGLAILAIMAGLLLALPRPTIAPNHVAVGKPAPQLDLVRLSDDLSLDRLSGLQAGDVTLLHFWGTWCPPCRMEYPHLNEMAEQLKSDERFRYVPVSCEGGTGETIEGLWSKTRDYFASEGMQSPAFADPTAATRRSVAARLESDTMFYPTSVLIAPDGKIAGVWEGYTPESVDQIRELATKLLLR